jgi:hypothetical protein
MSKTVFTKRYLSRLVISTLLAALVLCNESGLRQKLLHIESSRSYWRDEQNYNNDNNETGKLEKIEDNNNYGGSDDRFLLTSCTKSKYKNSKTSTQVYTLYQSIC